MTDSERIEELRNRLKGDLSKVERMTVLEAKNALKGLLYGQLKKTKDKNDPKKCKEMDDLALEIIQEGTKLIRKESLVNVQKLYEMIKECYQFRGRRHFKDFLIAAEWNFDSDMKLYQIRRVVFDEWAEYLEDLEYGRLRGLSISAPPRTGKTAIGTMFFMWCMLRHPEKSCFFVSHTAAMAKKVYTDILMYLTDEKKEIKAIFPEFEITGQNAEDLWIQLKRESSNPYHTAYFRGIDGNMAGILEASWLLYCDDLIKNIEEAMNPTRLETARTKYGVDITQRKANKGVRELHIATRWSTADVISSLENEFGNDPMWKFIRRAALNDDDSSNFMYEGDFALDTEYFKRQRNLPMMDEVSFSCIYQQEPIDREGLFVKEDDLKYYNGELPPSEPDFVGCACDVAWGGGDYLSMPIVKVYGTAVYVTDVVYSNKTKTITKPIVMGKILKENVQKAYFESNNGGEEYGEDVKRILKEEHNYKGFITSEKAPSNKSKLTRILAARDEITGISPNFQLIFLDKEHRNQEYALFMKHVFLFNTSAKFQGKQKDDCVDSLSMIVAHILESRVVKASVKSEFSRGDMDI